eukprot:TRINITY_DN67430_c0_g1_i1.p1 TRINITY_DN67430_c0_g1~~TRINITY_DN67430_c0_g1_i1.p1  ORF type:complete len:388 (-),score=96.77 TRINITY_DN67430_c0_g1_i1:46-1038(-)
MEVDLEPQIGRSREPSISFSGNKLKYQSEIRGLIKSYQDLGDPGDITSDSEIDGDYEDEGENLKRKENSKPYKYNNQNEQKRAKSVLFGSNTINQKIHEEFKLKAKRNESFKNAVNSPNTKRRGTLKEEIKHSMEDLHKGFKSVSRTNSINASMNSRASSLERTGSQASIGQLRRGSGSSGTGSTGRRQSQPVILSKQKSKSQERLKQKQAPLNKNLKNDLSAGLGILSRGLGPRSASREKIHHKTAYKTKSQDNLDEVVIKSQGGGGGHMQRTPRGQQSPKTSRGQQSPKSSRSRNNLAESVSREDLDKKSKQSFAGEFVDFYMGKRKT